MNKQKAFYTIVLMLIFASVNAQVGEISVRVRNTRGDEIYKVKVVATNNSDSSFVKEVKADRYGSYSVKPLPPGLYNLRISAKDYVSQEYSGIKVREDQTTHLEVRLEPIGKSKNK
jgi:hypothetical protein